MEHKELMDDGKADAKAIEGEVKNKDDGKARRGWSITEWKHLVDGDYMPEAYFKSLVDEGTLKYVHLGAWEKAPTTGKEHRHSLFWFGRNVKKTAIYKILGYKTFAKQSYHEEAYKVYSTKEGAGTEFGEMNKGGQRNDIIAAYETAKKTGSVNSVMDDHPAEYLKYHGGIAKVVDRFKKKPGFRNVQVHILNGKAGTGKSHYAACIHGEEAVFRLTKAMYESKFWRGYQGETVLVIEEFSTPWLKHEEFNHICDGQTFSVPVLYGAAFAMWDHVYITSNRMKGDYDYYRHVWAKMPELKNAFERRVTEVREFCRPRACQHVQVPIIGKVTAKAFKLPSY